MNNYRNNLKGEYMSNKKLGSHPLIHLLMNDIKPLTEKAAELLTAVVKKKGRFQKIRKPSRLNWPDSYYHSVFYHGMNLINAIDRLNEIKVFLSSFPTKKRYEKQGVSQDKWIRYHYANFVVTVFSLYDISLILTSFVFRLGIPESKCKTDVIVKNAWISGTKVETTLVELDKIVRPFREPRHLHVHRGQIPELEQLDELGLISFAQLRSKPIVPARTLRIAYSLAIRDILNNMDPEIEKLTYAIWNLFDALFPTYEQHSKAAHKFGL
jgi:hypothetical protein